MRASVFLFVLVSGLPASAEEAPDPALEQRSLRLGAVEELEAGVAAGRPPLVGNRRVLRLAPGSRPGFLKVLSFQAGRSSVILFGPDGKPVRKLIYEIEEEEGCAQLPQLRRMLRDLDGLELRCDGAQMLVEGRVSDARELDRVRAVALLFARHTTLRVGLEGNRELRHGLLMERKIRESLPGSAVSVSYEPPDFLLAGEVRSEADRLTAAVIAETLIPDQLRLPGASLSAPRIRNRIRVLPSAARH